MGVNNSSVQCAQRADLVLNAQENRLPIRGKMTRCA
jgi:hypothetical protein